MKKTLLFLVVFLSFLIPIVAYAQECEFAIPRYGILKCVNTQEIEKIKVDLSYIYEGKWSVNTLSCLSYCEINKENYIKIICKSSHNPVYEIRKNNKIIEDSFPISWTVDDRLFLMAKCNGTNNKTYNLLEDSYVEYNQEKIMLYKGFNESELKDPVQGTEGCKLKTFNDVKVETYLDPLKGVFRVKPKSYPEEIKIFSGKWSIGDYYSFVKAWYIDFPNISVTYDKENNYFWCEGKPGSRKIYSVTTFNDPNGNCYDVPQSIYMRNIECCFDSDCKHLGEKYNCNPDTWSCEETSPCDSHDYCKHIFDNDTCDDKTLVRWKCNYYRPWKNYRGSCEKEIIPVNDCPEECNNGYDYDALECKQLAKTTQDNPLQGYAILSNQIILFSSWQKIIIILLVLVIIIELLYYYKK